MERKWRTVNSRKLWLNTHKQDMKSVLAVVDDNETTSAHDEMYSQKW